MGLGVGGRPLVQQFGDPFQRVAGAQQWPHDHTLRIMGLDEDGFLTIPRGDDLTIVVDTSDGNVEPEVVNLNHGSSRFTAATLQMVNKMATPVGSAVKT